MATGVTPNAITITRHPVSSDTTRDGVGRALAFLAESRSLSAVALENEAKSGAFYLHTSGTTGTSCSALGEGAGCSFGNNLSPLARSAEWLCSGLPQGAGRLSSKFSFQSS